MGMRSGMGMGIDVDGGDWKGTCGRYSQINRRVLVFIKEYSRKYEII
jgi:hypothetical protein